MGGILAGMSVEEQESRVDVSIVVAVHNQEDTVGDLHDQLTAVMADREESYEVIYVDDGSNDGTADALRVLFDGDTSVRVIHFARHFGEQIANMAGLHHVRGDKVILLDPYTQVSLRHVPEFVDALSDEYDVVYADSRSWNLPLWHRAGRVAANWLIRTMTGIAMPRSLSGLVALKYDLVQTVNRYQARKRSLDSLLAYLAYGRHTTIPVTPRGRGRLHAKTSLWHMVRNVLSIVIAHSSRPLQLSFWAGCIVMVLAFLLVGYTVFRGVASGPDAVWMPLIVSVVTALSAIQLMAIGVLGEYLGRVYGEVRAQPLYTVAEVHERESDPTDARD